MPKPASSLHAGHAEPPAGTEVEGDKVDMRAGLFARLAATRIIPLCLAIRGHPHPFGRSMLFRVKSVN